MNQSTTKIELGDAREEMLPRPRAAHAEVAPSARHDVSRVVAVLPEPALEKVPGREILDARMRSALCRALGLGSWWGVRGEG